LPGGVLSKDCPIPKEAKKENQGQVRFDSHGGS
jgi:hypothetical protein